MFQPSPQVPESPREQRFRAAEQDIAETFDKAHGRLEHRRLIASPALNDYLDWPGVGQVFQIERTRTRTRTVHGRTSTEVAYGITSLRPEQADARRLLALSRGHWGIENSVFYVRDGTLGEDHCQVRTGHAPRVLATARNLVITLLNLAGYTNKAAACRRHAARPHEALALLNPPPDN